MEEFSGEEKLVDGFQKLNLIAVIISKKQTRQVHDPKMEDDKSHTNESEQRSKRSSDSLAAAAAATANLS